MIIGRGNRDAIAACILKSVAGSGRDEDWGCWKRGVFQPYVPLRRLQLVRR